MNFQYFFTLLNQLLGQRRQKKKMEKNVTLSKLHYDLHIDVMNSEEKYTQ